MDTGQIIIAQKLHERENDIYVMMVSWERFVMTPVTCLGFEYRSVHDGDRRDSQ